LLTAQAASLPYSTIENIGMTTVECILLTGTIFLFSYYLLKKQSFSVFYPLSILILFAIAGTAKEISTRITNGIIVYNTPGSSTIGIRTGKILNLYSDTSLAGPEVLRDCATHGLKIETNTLKNRFYCIRAGEKKILICNSLEKNTLQNFLPDIVVITGLKPEIENNLSGIQSPEALIVTSGASSGFRPTRQSFFTGIDTVHLIRKSGAFIRRI
jgi:hypothetical protein